MKYKVAINQKPIDVMVQKIRADENFLSLDEISDDFENAIISVEDQRFYQRYGVDVIAILRAMLQGLFNGELSGGASTITQQLAKNIYFDFDRSWLRKFAEIFMTYDLESNYTKNEILELYVNYIYYGDGYYGINQAAKGYFGKKANELNLAQSALLAGLVQSPSAYQLSNGFELAKKRQLHVLKRMLVEKVIDKKQYEDAINYKFDNYQ